MRTTPSLFLLALLLPACGGDKAREGQNAGECADGADNDGDGAFDCSDADCAGSPDCGGETGAGGDSGTTNDNAAPSGVAVAITPAAPGPDDALSCTIVTEAVDPDGEVVSYRYAWTVDGASAGIAEATVASTATEAGQTWTCTVTPTDGTLDGASASASVSIAQGNRAPSAPTVAIVPESPNDDDVLNCVITGESVDPDGDAVSYDYTWTVDGASAGISSAVVTADRTRAGELWACSVTGGDGELVSAAGVASATILPVCDADADGHDKASCGGDDCDDTDASIYPRAGDTYGDGVDGDCDEMDCEAGTLGSAYFALCLTSDGGAIPWSDADAMCRDAGYDALASVHSVAESEFAFALLVDAGLSRSEAPWIGLSDRTTEGTWVWSDGSAYDYTDWMAGEPNGGASEDCVQINPWDFRVSREWNDYACDPSGGRYGASMICGAR